MHELCCQGDDTVTSAQPASSFWDILKSNLSRLTEIRLRKQLMSHVLPLAFREIAAQDRMYCHWCYPKRHYQQQDGVRKLLEYRRKLDWLLRLHLGKVACFLAWSPNLRWMLGKNCFRQMANVYVYIMECNVMECMYWNEMEYRGWNDMECILCRLCCLLCLLCIYTCGVCYVWYVWHVCPICYVCVACSKEV